MSLRVVGLDLGHASVPEAEHWLADLPPVLGHPADLVVCTHLVHGPSPRVVITVATTAPVDLATLPTRPDTATPAEPGVALTAAGNHAARRAGRAVVYPGVDALTGTLSVADLLSRSAIERVVVLGGTERTPPTGTLLDTRGFVRPQWMDGRLTLVATPAPGNRIAPFEVPNPTPCCAAHA